MCAPTGGPLQGEEWCPLHRPTGGRSAGGTVLLFCPTVDLNYKIKGDDDTEMFFEVLVQ